MKRKILNKFRTGPTENDLLLSNLPTSLYRVYPSPDGSLPVVEMLNDKIKDLVGYDMKDFNEIPNFFSKILHPDDKDNLNSLRMRETFNGNHLVLEHRFLHADGNYRWLRRYVQPVRDKAGQIVEWLGCAFDITDLKTAEERLEMFLEAAPDAVLTVDERGNMVQVNYQATQLFGYQKSEMIGKFVGELVPPHVREEMRKQVKNYLKTPSSIAAQMGDEVICARKNGEEVPVELRLSDIKANGEILYAVAMRDISKRKKIEAQLYQAQKMEAVGQLTGGIAHDFNNLLTIMIGNLQLTEMASCLDDNTRKTVNSALEAAFRSAELTKRLLAFSRQQLLEPQDTDLNEIVNGIKSLIHRTLGENIRLKTRLTKNPWSTRVDPGQVENALINLAINARDALPDSGFVTIETSNVTLDDAYAAQNSEASAGDYVLISVSDDGVGIPKDKLGYVFDPFFSTKEVGKGSGLGLSMVYGFARQSGGHCTIYSEEGHGTVVKLYLPRLQAAAGVSVSPTLTQPEKTTPGGDEVILLVEDEKAVREIATLLLTNMGYRVHHEKTGTAALTRLDELGHVDLLFTDIVMPGGMNGVELADQARQQHPELKVLYTTGYTDTNIFDDGLYCSGDNVLRKPYLKEQLAQTVREVLGEEVAQ